MIAPRVAIIDDFFGGKHIPAAECPEAVIPSHGMTCSMIFRRFAKTDNVKFFPVSRTFHEKTEVDRLADVLNQARETHPDLIVMSMGTTNPLAAGGLVNYVNQAEQDGIAMVCACSNENVITFPASLSGVIGVRYDRSDSLANGDFCYIDNPYDGIDIVSSFPNIFGSEPGGAAGVRASNSITAQYIGATVCNIMGETEITGIRGIRAELKRRSTSKTFGYEYYKIVLNNAPPANDAVVVSLRGCGEAVLKIAERLSELFAEDGYCAGILGDRLQTNIAELHFSSDSLFSAEHVALQDKISFLFSAAKIDLLFLMPDLSGADRLADTVVLVGETEQKGDGNIAISPSCRSRELRKKEKELLRLLS